MKTIGAIVLGLLFALSSSTWAMVIGLPVDNMRLTNEAIQKKVEFLEKTSHEKAKKIPAVCAVVIDDPNEDALDLASGTYFARIGDSGFVLTAAHIAFKAQKRLQFLSLSFDSGYREVNKRITANNIYIHPDYQYSRVKNLNRDILNDIAIIEFDARKLSRGVVPLPLDDTQDYTSSKDLEGAILGYGAFGSNITTLQDFDTVHFGETYVSLDTAKTLGKEQKIFHVDLPHLSNYLSDFYSQIVDIYRFAPAWPSDILSTIIDSIPAATSFQLIIRQNKVHPRQGFVTPGDDGGPLLFKSKKDPDKFVLAGIAQSSGLSVSKEFYTRDSKGKRLMLKSIDIIWEPVFVHRDWIKNTLGITTHDEL